MTFELITTEPALLDALADLRQCHELALDLEFDNNLHNYGLTLCLVQVASRHSCYLFDPLRLPDLSGLWPLLEDPAITKILHSGSQDIMLLKTLGCSPRNLADTEVAARLLNNSRPSFGNLITEKLGIIIDKGQQASNWAKRPLSDAQLEYAAKDVLFLHALYDVLIAEIRTAGRESWLTEEGLLLEALEFRSNPDPHLKLKETSRLGPYHQFILKQLYALRDEWAQRYNQPPGRVLPNELLVRLTKTPIETLEAWNSTQGVFGPIRTEKHFAKYQQAWERALREADNARLSQQPAYAPRPPLLVSAQESGRRKQVLTQVREQIIATYGTTTTELIMTSGMIKACVMGHPLRTAKKYAFQIMLDAGAVLNEDLSDLLQLTNPRQLATEETDAL